MPNLRTKFLTVPKLIAMGHQVRIVPAQFVKPYVKSQKNDTIDAEAIAEAVTRGSAGAPPHTGSTGRQPHSAHQPGARLRLEYGVAIRQGAGVFRLDLPRVLADEANDFIPAMRRILAELFEDIGRIDQRIAAVTREIEGLAARDDRSRRLMTIPGIGPLAATALLAAVGDARQFRRARDLPAWLGLVRGNIRPAAIGMCESC